MLLYLTKLIIIFSCRSYLNYLSKFHCFQGKHCLLNVLKYFQNENKWGYKIKPITKPYERTAAALKCSISTVKKVDAKQGDVVAQMV